jgi:hypothetical protein
MKIIYKSLNLKNFPLASLSILADYSLKEEFGKNGVCCRNLLPSFSTLCAPAEDSAKALPNGSPAAKGPFANPFGKGGGFPGGSASIWSWNRKYSRLDKPGAEDAN